MATFTVDKCFHYEYTVVKQTPNPLMPSGWNMEEAWVPDYEVFFVLMGEETVVRERTKAEAIQAMKDFIAEAQKALATLESLE